VIRDNSQLESLIKRVLIIFTNNLEVVSAGTTVPHAANRHDGAGELSKKALHLITIHPLISCIGHRGHLVPIKMKQKRERTKKSLTRTEFVVGT